MLRFKGMGMARRAWAVQATYDAWRRIINRLENPQDKDWKNYGGRGLTMWPAWRASFRTFLQDVGPKPEPDRLLWLGLVDLSKGYLPGNVAWMRHQWKISHRRYCYKIPFGGESLTIEEAGRAIGLPPMTFRQRLLTQKLDLERAATPGFLPYRKNSKFLTLDGKTQSVPEWARALGLRLRTLRERLRRGLSPQQALKPGDLRARDSSRSATA